MVECGTLMTLPNQQLEARFCNMKVCPVVTKSAGKASIKSVVRKPQLIESKWDTDIQRLREPLFLTPPGARVPNLGFLNIFGLSNCSIFSMSFSIVTIVLNAVG